jgi:DNA-directed RNA polymerase specialized sigma subunit
MMSNESNHQRGRIVSSDEEGDPDRRSDILEGLPAKDERESDDLFELKNILSSNKAGLTGIEMKVIRLSFQKTPYEITLILGLKRTEVKEARERAIEKLRKVMVCN